LSVAARLRAEQQRLQARATVPPLADWLPVVMAQRVVGVAHPDVAGCLSTRFERCLLLDYQLVFDDDDLDPATRSALLLQAAECLRDEGLLTGWRNEQLDVRAAPDEAPIATIERAACRALGLATTAVHLNAFAADGRMWVARRAAHKQIDPGLLDNLVGGMVPAGESEHAALVREAMEEAGLDLSGWSLATGARIRVTRVVPEGYQVEQVQVFDTRLPADARPANQDGEVGAIECWPLDRVVQAMGEDGFTLEAALVALDGLLRHLPEDR
jgi:8-oxo-dGTP pyrophosphatase MutT (NUDIX family)